LGEEKENPLDLCVDAKGFARCLQAPSDSPYFGDKSLIFIALVSNPPNVRSAQQPSNCSSKCSGNPSHLEEEIF
jgi:hypothetical protein